MEIKNRYYRVASKQAGGKDIMSFFLQLRIKFHGIQFSVALKAKSTSFRLMFLEIALRELFLER